MDRKLLDYLPPVLREVMEMQAISGANEPEIALAWNALDRVLADQFLETADESGVAVWEKELRIFPEDTDTLELRKARVRAMWNRELPYTLPWLRRWLDSLYGREGHSESVEDYTLYIQLDLTGLSDAVSLMTEILRMLAEVLPGNMYLLLEGLIKGTFVNPPDEVTLRRFTQSLAFSERRNFVAFLLDGSVPLDGSALLNAVPSSMFGFPRLRLRSGIKNAQSLSRAALTTDSMYTLDGSVPLDGSRKLNAGITEEDL